MSGWGGGDHDGCPVFVQRLMKWDVCVRNEHLSEGLKVHFTGLSLSFFVFLGYEVGVMIGPDLQFLISESNNDSKEPLSNHR